MKSQKKNLSEIIEGANYSASFLPENWKSVHTACAYLLVKWPNLLGLFSRIFGEYKQVSLYSTSNWSISIPALLSKNSFW